MSLNGLPAIHLKALLDGLPVFERYGLLLADGYAFRARLPDLHKLFDSAFAVSDFTVTEDHLKVLRRAYVTWNQKPGSISAPTIDTKRPYGNSNEWADMAEILGVRDDERPDEDGNYRPDVINRFAKLHVETAIALQIALATGEFSPGRYTRAAGDITSWKRCESQGAAP